MINNGIDNQPSPPNDPVAQAVIDAAAEAAKRAGGPPVKGFDDFVHDRKQDKFYDLRTNAIQADRSVCKAIPEAHWERIEVQNAAGEMRIKRVSPDKTIGRDGTRSVQSSTWYPGMPKIMEGYAEVQGRIVEMEGEALFNFYIPPPLAKGGDAAMAGPWIDHVKRLWPNEDEHEYFFNYCAHMLQHPDEKCNASIVLSGEQGIGKDAALVPLKMAVGAYNCADIEPDALFARFRGFLQSLLIVVNEVRPAKDDLHATSMYNLLKTLSAAPPDDLAVEDKFAAMRYVKNRCRVMLTTNNYLALFIEPGDRRMMIMESFLKQGWQLAADEGDTYFKRLFAWIVAEGGWQHVAAFLRARDVSNFEAQNAPPKTVAWRAVVASAQAPDDAVSYALEKLGKPPVVLGAELQWAVEGTDMQASLNRITGNASKHMAHRMAAEGYTAFRPLRGDRWRFAQQDVAPIKSAIAFVSRDLAANQALAVDAILAHGQKLLRDRAARPKTSGAVIPLRQK